MPKMREKVDADEIVGEVDLYSGSCRGGKFGGESKRSWRVWEHRLSC
jgi:hypothetical protein